MRMQRSSVTFSKAFKLDGIDEVLPPGTYSVSTLDEETDTMLSQGWRRVSTSFCTPAVEANAGIEHWNSVGASDLERALKNDSA